MAGKPILLYGMGNGADKILDVCEQRGIPISGVFASDGFVRGQSFRGYTVTTYEAAKQTFGDMIVLVAFATSLPEVIGNIMRIAAEQETYVPDVPVYGDHLFDYSFAAEHKEELSAAYELFSDEESRRLFAQIVAYKLSGRVDILMQSVSADADGLSTLLHPKTYRVAADLGAYTGDTAVRLTAVAPQIESIHCFEPDPKTFSRLEKAVGSEAWAELYPFAAWDRAEMLRFRKGGSRSSRLGGEGKTIEVQAMPLDEVLGGKRCDYIKYDVEGADYEALRGSANTILTHRPELLLSLYHRSEDLFRLPLALYDICPDYAFYLRRARSVPAWDLNLIAIPKETLCV